MMKRILGIIALTCFISLSCYAGVVEKTLLSRTVLDDSPTEATATAVRVSDMERINLFLSWDRESTPTGTFTLQVSYDNSNWIDASFYDFAGGATLQTSEALTTNIWYFCWFDNKWAVPYLRAIVRGTATAADATAAVSIYLTGNK